MATKFSTFSSLYPAAINSRVEIITDENNYLVQNAAIQLVDDSANNALIVKNNDGTIPYMVLFDNHIVGFRFK